MRDPFKIETLIGWLKTKDPNEEYDYGDSGGDPRSLGCVLCQYFRANGFPEAYVSSHLLWPDGRGKCTEIPLPPGFSRVASCDWHSWTFGKALAVAEQLIDVA